LRVEISKNLEIMRYFMRRKLNVGINDFFKNGFILKMLIYYVILKTERLYIVPSWKNFGLN